jgi:hypothetical protein
MYYVYYLFPTLKHVFAHGAPYRFGASQVAPTGEVFVADKRNHRVQAFGPDGSFLRAFGRQGRAPGQLTLPSCVVVTTGGEVLVGDATGRISAFRADGTFMRQWGMHLYRTCSWHLQLKFVIYFCVLHLPGSPETLGVLSNGLTMSRSGWLAASDAASRTIRIFE